MVCTVSIHHVAAYINPNIKSLTLLVSKYASGYDLENWTCDMSKGSKYGHLYKRQCRLETVTRVLITIQFVAAAMVCAAAVWAIPAEQKKDRNVLEMEAVRRKPFKGHDGW